MRLIKSDERVYRPVKALLYKRISELYKNMMTKNRIFVPVMKKVLLIILTVFYLGLSSGATLHFHYCMGELISWGLDTQKKSNCDTCGMPKGKSSGKSCCKDHQQEHKVDKSEKAGQLVYQFSQPESAPLQVAGVPDYLQYLPEYTGRESRSNDPPLGLRVPVFIKNCTYRI